MSNENELEKEISEAAETVEETAEEAVETVEEAAEEAAETVEEAAEEAVEEAEEAVEEAEEAVEEAKDAVEEIKEKAEPVKTASKSAKAAPVIKKKKGINVTTLTVIIVCAVVVLACAAYVFLILSGTMIKKSGGCYGFPTKASYKIAPHDTIEISEKDLEVTDESIDSYVTQFQDAYKTTEEVKEGTVEDGDVVNISYVGTIDGEAFEGGSSDSYDLTIGSGTFIDGFEDGLIGTSVGETTELHLKFPEDYHSADLAGKDVVFTVTVLSKKVTTTPEVTDDFVKENSAEYTETKFGESVQLDTVEAYRSHVHDYLYDLHKDDSLEDALDQLIEVKSYDEKDYDMLYTYGDQYLDYYASMYGVDKETLAGYYGYEDSAAYLKHDTEYQLNLAMLYSGLAKELGITHTDADVDASIQQYMIDNDLSETYTLEDFKSINGEGWLYMYKNYQMNYEPVIAAMRDRIVIVPGTEEETAAETTAAN